MKITKIINKISKFREFLRKTRKKRLYILLGLSSSIIIAVALMLFFGGKDTLAAWFDESWAFRRRIPVTNNTTAETNVYITIANVDTSDTSRFQADCGDIRFTKENGQLLDYYIVSGCGTATTTLHVQFDTLIAGLQDIYMYYGNPSAANGFAGSDFSSPASSYSIGSLASEEKSLGPVSYWKFDEGYGTTAQDSMANNNDGTITGATWQSEDQCVSGKCIQFNGSSSYISGTNNLTGIKTISYWIKAKTTNEFVMNLGNNRYISSNGFLAGFGTVSGTTYVDGVQTTVGNEMVTNGNMETGSPPTGWNPSAGNTITTVDDEGLGGAGGTHAMNDVSTDQTWISQFTGTAPTSGHLYKATASLKAVSADGDAGIVFADASYASITRSSYTGKAWELSTLYFVAQPTTYRFLTLGGTISREARYDNVSLKEVSAPISANTWHHVTIVMDTPIDITSLSIGKIISGTTNYFNGTLDELKFYNYARSAAQIKADYAARGTSKGSAATLGSSKDQGNFLSSGLVGYWKMDENSGDSATDSSGNGLSGNVTAGTTIASGRFSNTRDFNSANTESVTINDNDLLEINSTSNYSGFAWIKPDSTAGRVHIFGKRDGSCSEGFNFDVLAGGTINLNMAENSVNYIATSTVAVPTTDWTFVGFIVDRKTNKATVYINGQPSGTQANITNMADMSNTCSFRIAAWGPLGDLYFDGKIDDVRIYNRALSPVEVSQLYNWAPGPVGYWNMDEKTGQAANDISGNGLSGTLGANSSPGSDDPTWTSGKFGGALKFDGSNDYTAHGNPTQLNFGTNTSFTVETWFKQDSDKTTLSGIVGKGGQDNTAAGFELFTNGATGIVFRLTWAGGPQYGTSYDIYNSSFNFADNKWHHITAITDRTNNISYIYVDGNKVTSNISISSVGDLTSSANFQIGKNGAGTAKGVIDDVRIYNYARSAKQVVEDMNAGHPAPGSPVGSAVGYWKFDEGYGNTTYNGGAGTGINGTITGATWSNTGKFGKALNFSGTSTYVDMGNTSPLQITSDLTISSWINLSSIDPTYARGIVSKFYNTAGNRGYRFGITSSTGYPAFTISADGTNTTTATSTRAVSTNTWVHVVVIYRASAGTADFYINGVPESTKTGLATSIYNVGKNFQIGTWDTSTNAHSFVGLIDDPKIYNFALTEDEIKLDYNHGSALVMGATSTDSSGNPDNSSAREYCIPGDTTSCSAPVAEWKMDEKTGTSTYDTSGNGNTGTLTCSGTGCSNPTWSIGKYGGGLQFGGTYGSKTNYVQTPNVMNFNNNFTISFWSKGAENNTWRWWLNLNNYGTAEDGAFSITSNNNKIRWSYGLWFTEGVTGTTTTLDNNSWYFITVGRNGSQLFTYINGKPEGTWQTTSVSNINTTANMRIGDGPNPTSDVFTGVIDQVRIYNYARTPAQIAWDYSRGGPVGWWKMDECQGTVANDSSGNSNSGTITEPGSGSNVGVGTCTGSSGTMWKDGVTGKFNSSLEFDGTDDYIGSNLVITPALTASNGIAYSAWIKTAQSSNSAIVGMDTNTGCTYFCNSGIQLNINSNTNKAVMVQYSAADNYKYAVSTTNVNDGNWHHIVGTRKTDGTLEIYVDGRREGTAAMTSYYTSTTLRTNIGVGESRNKQFFTGQIDDAKIFNYALTPTQIKTLYNDGAVRFGPSTGSP